MTRTPISPTCRSPSAEATGNLLALASALPLPDQGDAPEWIQLTPNGEFRGADGRGPYRIADADAVARQSMEAIGNAGVIDENHATDLALPRGEAAPARAWIKELAAREDGIWARVEWTKAGRELVADKAYRFISPVFLHAADGTVTRILRASLVNRPNLRGMAALNAATTETLSMDFMTRLRARLGLAETTSEDAVIDALDLAPGKAAPALQAQVDALLAPIAKAAGVTLAADASPTADVVIAAVATLGQGSASSDTVKALQTELATVSGELASMKAETARAAAETFVDGEIAKGRVGVKPLRDHYIARHAASPAGAADVRREIEALPLIGAPLVTSAPPADGLPALNAVDEAVARQLGLSAEDFAKHKKALGA